MSWLKKNSVLVPVDFSELSYQAIAPAKDFVEQASSLHLIHVLAPLHPADPAAIWDSPTEDERKQKVTEYLRQQLSEMNFDTGFDMDLEGIPIEIAIGDPAGRIVDYAAAIKTDLIVMPSHGYKGAKRFLVGSVAERVVRLSPCPVLILK